MELLLIATWYRPGNDQWRTRIIDQHGIDLIHHRDVVFALYHFRRVMHHVITQVVETKFVVRTISDICHVCIATGRGIGLVLVNAIYAQTKPFEKSTVPLLVTT